MVKRRELTVFFAEPLSDPTRVTIGYHFGRDRVYTVEFSTRSTKMSRSGDVLFCLGLLPAMQLDVDLVIDAPVDSRLLANAERIQEITHGWYPDCSKIAVRAPEMTHQHAPGRKIGLFYSGGIDSSYSLLTYPQKIGAFVTVLERGMTEKNPNWTARLRAKADAVAARHAAEAIIVETDFRRLVSKMINWPRLHGVFYVGVRHLLADHISHQIVAASDSAACIERPWGSHPLVDPLYGYEGATLAHHGLTDRFSKVITCASDPGTLAALQVCVRGGISEENCGRCYKCGFVMAALDCLGLRDAATNFPWQHYGKAKLRNVDDGQIDDFKLLRACAEKAGGREALIAQIDRALATADQKKKLLSGLRTRWDKKRRQMRFL